LTYHFGLSFLFLDFLSHFITPTWNIWKEPNFVKVQIWTSTFIVMLDFRNGFKEFLHLFYLYFIPL
jgi:hypothetical protein